jgi:predicted Ser/Thr protein kinase
MTSGLPERLGRYEVDDELGRGAMGVVYRARDPRLGRVVAIKALHVPPGDPSAAMLKQRFLNEGHAAGRLHHPNIVSVFDADEDPASGVAFLAMEYVQGTDLRELMRGGIDLEQLVGIVVEVANALDHAHRRGVVHRDVKPANVLIDSDGHAHLTDFGIARLGDSTLTRDGEFLGTPAYMSPEQVRSKPVGPATDVHALGVIVYEGLTGRRPYEGDSMVATATSIAADEAPRPSQVASIPAAFDEPVRRALAKDPEKRQASAGDFARELQEALAVTTGRPLPPAAPQGGGGAGLTTSTGSRRGPRGKRPWAAVAIGLAGLALIAVIALLSRRRATDPPAATTATAPVAATVRPAPPPVARGSVAFEIVSGVRGQLVVADGARELGRIDVEERRVLQFSGDGSIKSQAGPRSLSLTFRPREGAPLAGSVVLDVPRDGVARVAVDVGLRGREMKAKVISRD